MSATLKRILGFAGFAALWICGTAAAAEARAWLDRSVMHMGETVTLNVEVSGDSGAKQPDFNVLQDDFDLLGTQSSNSMSIVNGQTSSKLLWAVGLQPKHPGNLTIPAFTIGSAQTQALNLNVLPAPTGAVGKAGDDLFVTVDAVPRSPYVQQEVQLTVKLYYALSLIDGNLEDPKADGLIVRKLGQDSNYSADVAGRRYRVVERHYAAHAEKSGTLEVPVIAFRGRALDSGDINSFFSRGRNVSAQAQPIALDVRARPPGSGSDTWLPARSLSLNADGIDAGKQVHAGEPVTLTLRLKAQGLGFEQLPELELPNLDGADVYPDRETTQNRDDGTWIYGSRERKFAIVPSRPGTLTIPPINIAWWDTEHDRAAQSEIPSQTITVLPAQGTAAPQATAPGPAATAAPPPLAPVSTPAPTPAFAVGDGAAQWRLLALGSLVLWLLTLLAAAGWWLRRRRNAPAPSDAQARPAKPGAGSFEFRAACTRNDMPTAARALLRLARRQRPALRNLGELARAVDDERQRAAIAGLERALYGGGDAAGLGERLHDAFRNGPHFAPPAHAAHASALPPLYPFDVRGGGG